MLANLLKIRHFDFIGPTLVTVFGIISNYIGVVKQYSLIKLEREKQLKLDHMIESDPSEQASSCSESAYQDHKSESTNLINSKTTQQKRIASRMIIDNLE